VRVDSIFSCFLLADLSLHFLAKMKILVVKDIERDEVEFVCKTLGCQPVAHVDSLSPDKLGSAGLVEEVSVGGGSKVIKITGVANPGRTVSLLVRGSNRLVLDETDRSIHDALCVVRSLVKRKFLIAGGGAPETQLSVKLGSWSKTLTGMHAVCVKAFADALEIIPYTLAENAGMNPIAIVTELRRRHAEGGFSCGINVKRGAITDMLEEHVLQPMLVSSSAIALATETVRMILKVCVFACVCVCVCVWHNRRPLECLSWVTSCFIGVLARVFSAVSVAADR
jgi:T-complex protein 1 subunit delta